MALRRAREAAQTRGRSRGGQQAQRDECRDGGFGGDVGAAVGFEAAARKVEHACGQNAAGMRLREDCEDVLQDPDQLADHVGWIIWVGGLAAGHVGI